MVYSPSGHLHNRLLQELLEIEREVAEGDGTWAWELLGWQVSPLKWCSTCSTRSTRSTFHFTEVRWNIRNMIIQGLPSGELTFCNGKSPFFMGKSTIFMAIFLHQRVLTGSKVDIPFLVIFHLRFDGIMIPIQTSQAPDVIRTPRRLTCAGFHMMPSGKHIKSYWTWPLIVDFPIKNGDFNHGYVIFCMLLYASLLWRVSRYFFT